MKGDVFVIACFLAAVVLLVLVLRGTRLRHRRRKQGHGHPGWWHRPH